MISGSRFSRGLIWAAIACAVALGLALYLVYPHPASADGRAMMLPTDPAPLVVETSKGERSFAVEIADDAAERSAGLMFRESMADDRGMLFVFPETKEAGFWMKNTPMPLDLIFIGEDGRGRGTLPGEPFSEAVISPGKPVRLAYSRTFWGPSAARKSLPTEVRCSGARPPTR